jgi:hypothetical protein
VCLKRAMVSYSPGKTGPPLCAHVVMGAAVRAAGGSGDVVRMDATVVCMCGGVGGRVGIRFTVLLRQSS